MGRYDDWPKSRRYDFAVSRVLEDGWSVSAAARTYGVNRSHLYERVKRARVAREGSAGSGPPRGEQERAPVVSVRRRVGSFEEFFDTYFGGWVCPDCNVHHGLPGFHREVIDALESGALRVVVNLPPYHAKSTLVTVWHTVYDICRNPNSRTIIVSKSAQFAKAFLHSIKDILTVPELYESSRRNLIEDFGPFMPAVGGWNEHEIYVMGRSGAEKDPTVLSMGYGTQIYGRRADKIKFDDIATLENQRNPERVQQMLEWLSKEALSRIGKSGQAVWVGTRVAPGDVYSFLTQRQGYRVVRYPAVLDEGSESVLWPEHFPWSQVMTHRSEMSEADFQLVFQNVEVPGVGASFPFEVLEACKDRSRSLGHYSPQWRLVAGLDPGGGSRSSSATVATVLAVDLASGRRFLVDQVAEKGMKAPQLKDLIFRWADTYPLYEWRVESNGLQSQIVQYNDEIVRFLASKGVRVMPHFTSGNKWDPEFGVSTMAPLFESGMFSVPWAGSSAVRTFQPLLEELAAFPVGSSQDRVMSLWFAELGCRDLLRRAHLPLFNERLRSRWPSRISRRARVVSFEDREIRRVSPEDLRAEPLSRLEAGYRRRGDMFREG